MKIINLFSNLKLLIYKFNYFKLHYLIYFMFLFRFKSNKYGLKRNYFETKSRYTIDDKLTGSFQSFDFLEIRLHKHAFKQNLFKFKHIQQNNSSQTICKKLLKSL